MKIGIIGYGGMAEALAGKWAGKHEVMLSGRTLDKARVVAGKLGVKVGSATDAVAFGDAVVLATRHEDVFDAIESAGGAAAFAGKTVVDINNPISIETFRTTRTDGRSLTEAIAAALPDAHVGKAFNMAQVRVWADPNMTYDGRQMVTLYTADSGAEPVLRELIADVGADPLLLGDNLHAYQLEAAAAIIIKQLFAGAPPHTILNLIHPDAKPIR
ncbi:MAG: NAD(P)-binding domain-containing protein [Pseudomonadota bacterium]